MRNLNFPVQSVSSDAEIRFARRVSNGVPEMTAEEFSQVCANWPTVGSMFAKMEGVLRADVLTSPPWVTDAAMRSILEDVRASSAAEQARLDRWLEIGELHSSCANTAEGRFVSTA